ncbi:expressed unknown protein [Seminavis robusta]|uniref:Uncharacterized protein n=1 Tax=Seminavis robusta TaxID=568900 RepID=A0A9N8I0S8_9STRA|nr:expressed unknown protein [Seminavis robusta]|eukprot:Sro2864_g338890.1 n/a (579) ;mRNA; r:3848-5769
MAFLLLLLLLFSGLCQAQQCQCDEDVSPALLDFLLATDDNHLGSALTVENHDDSNSWFSLVHFDDTVGNPTLHYRYCELPRHMTAGGPVRSPKVKTPVHLRRHPKFCLKGLSVKINYLRRLLLREDATSGGCPLLNTDEPRAVLAFAESGTICMSFQQADYSYGDTLWTEQTECYSLQDASKHHRLVLESRRDTQVESLFVEFSLKEPIDGNHDVQGDYRCGAVEVQNACRLTNRNRLLGVYRWVRAEELPYENCTKHPNTLGPSVGVLETLGDAEDEILYFDDKENHWLLLQHTHFCSGTSFYHAKFQPGADTIACWNNTQDGLNSDMPVDTPLSVACRPADYQYPPSQQRCDMLPNDVQGVIFSTDCIDGHTARLDWTQCEAGHQITKSEALLVGCEAVTGSSTSRCHVQQRELPNAVAYGSTSPSVSEKEYQVTFLECNAQGQYRSNALFATTCMDQYGPEFPVNIHDCGGKFDVCVTGPIDCDALAEAPDVIAFHQDGPNAPPITSNGPAGSGGDAVPSSPSTDSNGPGGDDGAYRSSNLGTSSGVGIDGRRYQWFGTICTIGVFLPYGIPVAP